MPFITCEMSFCQNVCELILGVNIPDPNLWIQIYSVKEPIKRNTLCFGNMSQQRTSAFHLITAPLSSKNVQNPRIQIDSFKQPIKRNSVGSGNMSQIRTSAFHDHLD